MLEDRAVRKCEVPAICGISMTQVDRLEGRGAFPQRFTLGDAPNSPVAWWLSELMALLKARPTKQRGNSPFARR